MTANRELKAAFKETNRLLNKEIDPLMLSFEEKRQQFFGEYKATRRIYDLGVRHNHNDEPPPKPQA